MSAGFDYRLSFAGLHLMALVICCGCGPEAPPNNKDVAKGTRKEQIQQLKSFAEASEKISTPPAFFQTDVDNYYSIVKKGDLSQITQAFWNSPNGIAQNSAFVETPAWWAMFDVDEAFQLISTMEPNYVQVGVNDIFQRIPPGSIYMGGSAPGICLIAAFSKSRRNGDPFFTMSHNSITMDSYLDYLRQVYGSEVKFPSKENAKEIRENYVNDIRKRLDHDIKFPQEPRQLLPGETIGITNQPIQLAGTIAAGEACGKFVKWMMDKNPTREFYIEMAFPIEGLIPYLQPRGPVFRINREPLKQLSDDDVVNDRKYWSQRVAGVLGDWLTPETPVTAIAEFEDRIYVQKDYRNFKGDRRFVENGPIRDWFARLRYYDGITYLWRSEHTADETERRHMQHEADFAFRQAFALSPSSMEAVFGYLQLLEKSHRTDDALQVISTSLKLNPKNANLDIVRKKIEQTRAP